MSKLMGLGLVVCLFMLVYAWMEVSDLRFTIGELNAELVATKTSLEDAQASYKSSQASLEVYKKNIDNTKTLLSQCYLDLDHTKQAIEEIEEITKEPAINIEDKVKPDNVKVVTAKQEQKGLDFLNKQIIRLEALSQ